MGKCRGEGKNGVEGDRFKVAVVNSVMMCTAIKNILTVDSHRPWWQRQPLPV